MIDIADLDLSGVDVIRNSGNVVGVAKHLCGAATDLALRCLVDTLPDPSRQESNLSTTEPLTEEPLPSTKPRLLGVAMALCCHHRCTWSALVGRDFLEHGCGFLPEEFSLLCKLTSWAVCGIRPEPGKLYSKL